MPITSGVIKLCLLESEKSNYRFKIGAVVFKGSRILSSGHNEIRSVRYINNRYKTYLNSLHAEQAALLHLDWNRLKNASICIIRATQNGTLGNAFPCPICMGLIQHVKIKTIWYSNADGNIVSVKV